jgi:hypothetical protein
MVLVEPETVAVSVVAWPRIRVAPDEEVTVTETTLALPLLPQPLRPIHSNVATNATPPAMLRNFIYACLPRVNRFAVRIVSG